MTPSSSCYSFKPKICIIFMFNIITCGCELLDRSISWKGRLQLRVEWRLKQFPREAPAEPEIRTKMYSSSSFKRCEFCWIKPRPLNRIHVTINRSRTNLKCSPKNSPPRPLSRVWWGNQPEQKRRFRLSIFYIWYLIFDIQYLRFDFWYWQYLIGWPLWTKEKIEIDNLICLIIQFN